MANEYRVTWKAVEVLHVGVAAARVTWKGVEVLHAGQANARVTWIGVEVLRSIASAQISDDGFVSILW